MLTLDTTATRNPAAMTGTATGSSTSSKSLPAAVAHGLRGRDGVVWHRVQPVGHDPDQQRQRVKRQRDNNVDRIEDLRPQDHRQDDEQRERGNRVEQARGSDDRGLAALESVRPPAERQRDDEPEDRRHQGEPGVADRQRDDAVDVRRDPVHAAVLASFARRMASMTS